MNFRALRFLLLPLLSLTLEARPPMTNVYARSIQSLDGKWNTIVDPYDNGYYDYRQVPFDAAAAPTRGYFLDR